MMKGDVRFYGILKADTVTYRYDFRIAIQQQKPCI